MLTSDETDLLHRLAAWIVPPDDAEPVGGAAAIPYLVREIGTGAASAFLSTLKDFLAELRFAGFDALLPPEQDAFLARFASHPAFIRLAELINEGFYTAPEGLAMVGFSPVRLEALR